MEQHPSPKRRPWLRGALNTVVIIAALIIGFFLLLMLIFAHPTEQFAILTLYPATVALLLLLVNGQRKKKWFRWVLLLWAALVLTAGGRLGLYYYEQSIPTVSDRSVQISRYHPFEEDTQAVTLPEESTLRYSFEEASTLRIDGATALYPVYASFAHNVFAPAIEYYNWGEDQRKTLDCSGTTLAYDNLIRGYEDVIFCAEPSEKQLEAAKEAGVQLHLTPIGREAFVFFVNAKNPVTGLTVEQIQRIYTGEITNWKAVGGRNQKIKAYQRDEGSGSQTALQMLMAGLPLMEPDREKVVGGMAGIIEQVAAYRNLDGALGFSFRFYSNEMVGNDQIRLLSLNGAAPTKDTIRDGSYPISSYFYAITASPIGQPAPEETNPTLKAFLDWCQGPQGQWIVEEVGYVGLETPTFKITGYAQELAAFPTDRVMQPIPSAEAAKAAAEALWLDVFGTSVLDEKSYRVCRDESNAAWLVMGSLPQPDESAALQDDGKSISLHFGGVAHCIIQDDGRVLALWHTR